MSILCRIGMHKWMACKCSACSKTRNQDHDWSADCGRCSRCRVVRKNAHRWENGKCAICGKPKPSDHLAVDVNGKSLEMHAMSAKRKALVVDIWRNSPSNFHDNISDLYFYGVSSFEEGDKNENWGRLRTLTILWGEKVVRECDWDWFEFGEKGDPDEPMWAIVSKDRRNIIVLEMISIGAVSRKLPASILKTLYSQIINGEPLAHVGKPLTLADGAMTLV